MDILSYALGKKAAPQPTGTLQIDSNGTYDVSPYASAEVSISMSNYVPIVRFNTNLDQSFNYQNTVEEVTE